MNDFNQLNKKIISGEVTEGQCGRHCEGSSADNIGIIEYDTILDKIVGTHPFSSTGAAVDAPFTSPDGDRLVVPSLNGGQNIEIWTPGQNGELTVSVLIRFKSPTRCMKIPALVYSMSKEH